MAQQPQAQVEEHSQEKGECEDFSVLLNFLNDVNETVNNLSNSLDKNKDYLASYTKNEELNNSNRNLITGFVDTFNNIKTELKTLLDDIKKSDENCKAKLNA